MVTEYTINEHQTVILTHRSHHCIFSIDETWKENHWKLYVYYPNGGEDYIGYSRTYHNAIKRIKIVDKQLERQNASST